MLPQTEEDQMDERDRMTARLEELGPVQVAALAAVDGFPHTWRLGVADWLNQKQWRSREDQAEG
jgi:hypothetical protein